MTYLDFHLLICSSKGFQHHYVIIYHIHMSNKYFITVTYIWIKGLIFFPLLSTVTKYTLVTVAVQQLVLLLHASETPTSSHDLETRHLKRFFMDSLCVSRQLQGHYFRTGHDCVLSLFNSQYYSTIQHNNLCS
jgi:hypothetical protein